MIYYLLFSICESISNQRLPKIYNLRLIYKNLDILNWGCQKNFFSFDLNLDWSLSPLHLWPHQQCVQSPGLRVQLHSMQNCLWLSNIILAINFYHINPILLHKLTLIDEPSWNTSAVPPFPFVRVILFQATRMEYAMYIKVFPHLHSIFHSRGLKSCYSFWCNKVINCHI